ncbi:MAG: LuxR C-terminal-related transcriptional regulator, partial [Dehalococcoidia bacterium]
ELRRTDPARVPMLHQRAAAWHRAAGNADAAMRHAVAAGDMTLAGDIFLEFWQPYQRTGRLATVVQWRNQFPDHVIAARPPLALVLALITAVASRHREDIAHYLNLAQQREYDGPLPFGWPSVSDAVAYIRAAHSFGDVGEVLRAARALMLAAVDPDPDEAFSLAVRQLLGRALYLTGRMEDGRAVLEDAISARALDRNPVITITSMAHLTLIHLELGNFISAEDVIRRAIDACESQGLSEHPSMWIAHIAHASVLLQLDRANEAELILMRYIEPHLHDFGTWTDTQSHALLTLAQVRHARGHLQAARALLDEARAVVAAAPDPGIFPERVKRVDAALRQAPRRRTPLREDLTEAELRVLRLLAGDLSRREIGRELYLSVNTVKAHTRAIYAKLEAFSRPEAVARARSLELIA